MKKAMLVAALLSLAGASSASGQYVDRVYDKGSAWIVTRIDVKPGQYNAYLKWWRETVLPRIEYGKKAGNVLSYHMLNNNNPRTGEPDLYVLVEYKNMAAIDQPFAYFDDMDKKLAGSFDGRAKQMASGRELSEFMGTSLLGEVVFPK